MVIMSRAELSRKLSFTSHLPLCGGGGNGVFSVLVEVVIFETQLVETLKSIHPTPDLMDSSALPCSRIELRALGKISEGEELTVSYIDFLNVSEERKRQLKKQYYFDCTCEHCQKGLKDDLFLGVKDDPKVQATPLLGCFWVSSPRAGQGQIPQLTKAPLPWWTEWVVDRARRWGPASVLVPLLARWLSLGKTLCFLICKIRMVASSTRGCYED